MKISPIPHGGMPGTNLTGSLDRTADADKMAAAKAIAAGESPIRVTESDAAVDPQIERARQSIRKIKMRTNVSPDRPIQAPPEEIESAISDTDAQAEAVTEETKPLSPQFAALAKQRRALQVKERELADREKALESRSPSDGNQDLIARLKSQPLSVLQEHGVTYDQLTEAILSNQDGVNPEIIKLREEIKAIKEGVDKNLTDRDTQAEQQVLAEMQKEAEALVKTGDDYAAIQKRNGIPSVMRLIYRTYKESGEILDVQKAMGLVESALIDDALELASIEKVKSKLVPAQPQPPQQRQNYIRTLTNRDSSSVGLSRRERAMMAMNGTLK